MKLLSNKEIQEKENAEAALRISRIKELRDGEAKLRTQMTSAELEFQNQRIEKLKEWEKEDEEHRKDVEARKREIADLEAQKLAASIPFEILKAGADEKVKAANDFLESVKAREFHAEELKESLEEKLTAVEDREDIVAQKEKKVAFDEQRAQSSLKESHEAQERLAQAVIQFNNDSAHKRSELQAKETSLTLKEESLKSKEESLIGREKELEKEKKRLRDGQDVLARAWAELNRKK